MNAPPAASAHVQAELAMHGDRVFRILVRVGIVVCALFAPLNAWIGDPVGVVANLVILVTLLGTARYRRRGGSLARALDVLSLMTLLAIGAIVWRQGGLYAPTLWWLVVVPFTMVSCGRPRAGQVWTLICALAVALVLVLTRSGYLPPPAVPVSATFYALVIISLFVFLHLFHAFTERARRRALDELSNAGARLSASAVALEHSNQALASARDRALHEAAVKSRLMANISHELRTPLNAVLGAVALLERDAQDESARELTHMLERSGRHLLDVVNDVLDFSRLEAGRLQLETLTFEPRSFAENTVELFTHEARVKGLRLTLDVTPAVPAQVHADEKRLRQVLINLVGNAIKFTPAGRIDVTLDAVPGTPAQHGMLVVTVADSGVGIAADALERIFEPFEQADGSLAGRRDGTGLGLAICHELARLMGGTLAVESRPGVGSTFRFTAPVRVVAAALGTAAAVKRPDVLVIEPDTATRTALAHQLAALGVAAPALHAVAPPGPPPAPTVVLVAHDCLAAPPPWLLAATAAVVTLSTVSARPPGAGRVGEWRMLSLPCRSAELAAALAPSAAQAMTRVPAGPAATVPQVSSPGPAVAPPRDLRVLLAEDNDANRRVAVAMLRKAGCTPDVANDGEQAVAAAREVAYDLVFMDCRMPRLDGLDATRAIRALEHEAGRAAARIVALTGDALESDRLRCLEAGMDAVIKKPFFYEELVAELDRAGG